MATGIIPHRCCVFKPFESCEQGEQSAARGGPFAVLNGATATDVVCVAVPAGVQLEQPIHLLHLSASALPPPRIMPCGPSCHLRARPSVRK